MPLLHQPAFGGDVKLAFVGIDQRNGRGQGDIPRQHRFVDFTPERVPPAPLNTRVGQAGVQHVGQHIDRDRQRGRVDDVGVAEQKGQRSQQEDQPRNAGEKVQHGVGITESLHPLKPFTEQGVIQTEDLHHAACPADSLSDMRRQALGRQSGGLRNTDIGRGVTQPVQAQRGMRIFRYGFDRDAANLLQRGAAQNGAGAAEEGRIPGIVAILNQAVEE